MRGVRFLPVILFLCSFALSSALFNTANAQEERAKPELVPIILNEETNDAKASAIVNKLYEQHIERNDLEGLIVYDDIYARFVPLQSKGSNDLFIVAKIMEPPLGCYAKGCSTDIYHSKDGKNWRPVWAGHIHNIWYDENTRETSPANLIMTSNAMNRNPGVWMWASGSYFLANRNN